MANLRETNIIVVSWSQLYNSAAAKFISSYAITTWFLGHLMARHLGEKNSVIVLFMGFLE